MALELGEPVDASKLREDVRKLLFKDCKDTTTWDHLGNLDPVKKREEKHVTIADASENQYHDDRLQYVVLPPSLSLLYGVTQDKLEADGKDTCDLLTLLEYAAKPMEAMGAHDRLYQHAVDRRIRLKAEDDERKRLAREEEDGHCTFKPIISETAGRVQGKNSKEGGYYGEGLDWRKACAKKLKKKVDKESKEKWEETMQPWEMNKRSVKLVQRKTNREKEERKRRAHTSSPVRRVITPRSHRYAARDEAQPTFTPLTNSNARRELLVQLGSGFQSGDLAGEEEGGNMSFEMNPTTVVDNLQSRIQEDIDERRVRIKQRAIEYERSKSAKQFDRITGQPLFKPNAMPIITDKHGNKRKFTELNKKEQEATLRHYRHHRIDFVLPIAKKQERTGNNRDMDQCIQNMLQQHNTAHKKMDKKRRKAAAEEVEECVFKPKIDKRSHDLVSNSDRGAGYLTLTKAQKHREGRFGEGSDPDRNSTKEVDRHGNPKKKLSDEGVKNLLLRQERFGAEREQHRAKSRKSIDREEQAECTFKPKLSRETARLMEEAERRMGSQSAPAFPQQRQPNTERSKSALTNNKPPTTTSHSGTTPLVSPHNTSGSMRRRGAAAGPVGNVSFGGGSVRSEHQADYASPSWSPSAPPAGFGSPIAHQPMDEYADPSSGLQGTGLQGVGLDDLEGLLADWSSFSRSLSQPSQTV